MLHRLTVSNLAVVEKAEADFAPGLNVLTGETGAGKSVLMGALSLVLGGRADASLVRDGAKEAEVEADFGDRVVRRTVSANGHSRAWIDDEAASVADLREFGRTLVDIHGPRSNQLLLEESFQRRTLDAYGGHDDAFRKYSAAWSALQGVCAEIEKLLAETADDDAMDLLRYQVGELSEAGLSPADEDLAERHAAAAHAEEIVEAANEMTEALGGDDGAAAIVAKLRPRFAAVAKHLPEAEDWAKESEDIVGRIEELSRTIADAAAGLDVDSAEFEEMDARLGVVNRLRRKYLKGGGTIADLIGILDEKKARLESLEGRDEKLAELGKARAAAAKSVSAAGAALTKARSAAAAKLARAVTGELRDLGFVKAKFAIRLDPSEPDATGCDRVVFLLEPNPGEASRPLADIASSGEIARVMLAVKAVTAAHDETGTLVFDEIDANIGGEVGKVVGEKMRNVGRRRQVIAITHLPQIAVFGERHLVVAKSVSDGRTRTAVEPVEGEERAREIARMLGGEKITSVAMRHAEELLEVGSRKGR